MHKNRISRELAELDREAGERPEMPEAIYQHRYRAFDPLPGRWVLTDPAGYVDNATTYPMPADDAAE